MQYLERHWESMDWITLFLMGSLVLVAISSYLYPKRFQEFILLPITNKYFLIQGKNDEIRHPFNVLLFFVQVISVSLFIHLFFTLYAPQETLNNTWLFLQICTAYVIFVFIKYTIEKIIGDLFSIETRVNNYLYQKLSYRNLFGLLIFVSNLVFYYILKPTTIGLLVVVVLIVLFNGIALLNSYKSNGNKIISHLFYFILYLCALEISPYIILYKVLK